MLLKSQKSFDNKMDIKEFEIPVPWGHIAVKAWGNEQNTPVFAVHGLSDNAGSFDRIIPYLPTFFYYICIDLPGQGRSSLYPPHLFITAVDDILTIKLILDYLDRRKYIFMGHSWGGQIGILFTQLYPEYILKLIVFDSFYLYPWSLNSFQSFLRGRVDTLVNINKKLATNKQPSYYTYEEAVDKLIEYRYYRELSRESAEALAKRGLVPMEGEKFKFSIDLRLKALLNFVFGMNYITDLVKKYPITCPMLFIAAFDSRPQLSYFKTVIKEFQKNKHCVIKQVVGTHDVHNNSPEIVGPIVNTFLMDGKSKL